MAFFTYQQARGKPHPAAAVSPLLSPGLCRRQGADSAHQPGHVAGTGDKQKVSVTGDQDSILISGCSS